MLGFLCAGFLALLIAPSIWRRAVKLTRKRVEASVPLTLEEIQADKDRLRAEFAMAARRLEISLKAAQEKVSEQAVEISRGQEALRALAAERADKSRTVSALEAEGGDLKAELGKSEQQVQALSAQLAESEHLIEQRSEEIERIARMYDEASFSSSNRQIELVARESEMGKLSDDASVLRNQAKDTERRLQEVEADNSAVRDALKAEKKRAAELDQKVETMIATLSDRNDKLERRERELARLRQNLDAQSGAQVSAIEKARAGLFAERDRLEGRLTALMRENKKLKAEIATSGRSGPTSVAEGHVEDAVLREQMQALAAEVVTLTAKLEGPDSPIVAALAAPGSHNQAGDAGGAPISLADRVRALQKAAPAS